MCAEARSGGTAEGVGGKAQEQQNITLAEQAGKLPLDQAALFGKKP